MESKKSLLLYYDYIEHFELLDDKQLRKVIYAMIEYDKNDNMNDLDEVSKMAFSFIKKNLDRDKTQWINIKNRNAENGKKGGRPKTQDNPKNPVGYLETQDNPKNPLIVNSKLLIDNSNIKEKNIKKKYGEFNNVFLKDEELEKLKDKYIDWNDKIEKLSLYIESKGTKYKSHYATIISWASKDKSKEEIIFRKEDNIFERKEQDERNQRFRI